MGGAGTKMGNEGKGRTKGGVFALSQQPKPVQCLAPNLQGSLRYSD